jgi:hypothetical protein
MTFTYSEGDEEQALDDLARCLLNIRPDTDEGSTYDHTLAFQCLKVLIPNAYFVDTIASMMELCPEHGCDSQICRDDEQPCKGERRLS